MKSNQAGLTLVEVIAVVLLIAIIASVVGGKVFSTAGKAKAGLNKTKMTSLMNQLQTYKLQYNSYPSNLQGLVKPSAETKNSPIPFSAFVKDEDLLDVWGTAFVYTAENNGRSFVLKSLGEDGVPGGDGTNSDIEERP